MSLRLFVAVALAVAGLGMPTTPSAAQTIRIAPGQAKNLALGRHHLTIRPKIDNSQLLRITACPDPAATLTISHVRSYDHGFKYKFDLNAVVRNAGRAAWRSRPRQQTAELVTRAPGGRRHFLATRDFTRLNPGASMSFTAAMTLNGDDEFPPEADLVIVYDPDIRADGNAANDDCRMGDNAVHLSGAQLLRRVRAAAR